MNPIPFIPDNAPFNAEQRQWLNGYLAGLFSNANLNALGAGAPSAAPAAKPLAILFGSQTGTAEGLAKKTGAAAKKHGFAPQLVCMDKYESLDLSKASSVLVITSTYGDGEPPDNAQAFWDYLKSEAAPACSHLHYSVLALGDTNYSAFCEFGKRCDERLEQLGAKRIHPRIDCDVDYDALAQAWTDAVLQALVALDGSDSAAPQAALTDTPEAPNPEAEETGFSRKRPFPARLLTNRLLNAPGSGKEVRHFEISLEGSGLSYEVGDALGVYPLNCSELVSAILSVLGCDGEEAVLSPSGEETSFRQALLRDYDLGRPSSELLSAIASRSSKGELQSLLEPARREELKSYLFGRDVLDLLGELTTSFSAPEFVAVLKKIQPRLYSISSSPKAHPNEVHLTVAAVRYETQGRIHKGVCSTFLADRVGEQVAVPVFVQLSHGFRLPTDLSRPIIMVGPGTGIAPFRAFLEERRATGATGKNWLFFGDQKQASDFLYREELEAMQSEGHLTRLDLAFSRDQAEKIYVQTRMLENAAELWQWLEEGAHVYVCGDASRMAKDVDGALQTILESAGGLSAEAASAYLARLKSEKRYQRDVY